MTLEEYDKQSAQWGADVVKFKDHKRGYMDVTHRIEKIFGIAPIEFDGEEIEYETTNSFNIPHVKHIFLLGDREVRTVTRWENAETEVEYTDESEEKLLSFTVLSDSGRSVLENPFIYLLKIYYWDGKKTKEYSLHIDINWNFETPIVPEIFEIDLLKQLRGMD